MGKTRFEDALDILGQENIELVRELQEDEEKSRLEKGELEDGMIYKSSQERMERMGDKIFSSCLSNILNDATIVDKIESIRSLGKEAIEILKEKRMSKSRYVGIGGSHSLKAAVRYLQSLLGTKDLEIDLETLKAAVMKNIINLPPGAREKAALQLKADLATFPSAEPTKPGSVRWIARLSSQLDPSK